MLEGIEPGTIRKDILTCLHTYKSLDQPQQLEGALHISIGYINQQRPFNNDLESAQFAQGIADANNTFCPMGEIVVDKLWLIHYANRTLDKVIGKAPLQLGRTNSLSPETFCSDLGFQ